MTGPANIDGISLDPHEFGSMEAIRHHQAQQHRLLLSFAHVIVAVLDSDRAMIPDDVWEAAEDAKAVLDEVAL